MYIIYFIENYKHILNQYIFSVNVFNNSSS